MEFKTKTKGRFNENERVTDEEIYDFIAWAGETLVEVENGPARKISAATIKNYLNGIRAWQVIKHRTPPTANQDVVKLLLDATKNNEETKALVTEKQPVMINQLFALVQHAHGKSAEHDLVATTAIVAFWGMARLGELLRESAGTGALLRRHVEFGERDGEAFVKLHLRKAKTAKAGEVQVIHLQRQYSVLDPVSAIERLMKSNKKADRDDLLFATSKGSKMTPMKKARFISIAEECWGKASLGTWSGHSFRVGGASIRFNLGTPVKKIARQGRWKSLTYLRYFKAYTDEEKAMTIRFLEAIEDRNVVARLS